MSIEYLRKSNATCGRIRGVTSFPILKAMVLFPVKITNCPCISVKIVHFVPIFALQEDDIFNWGGGR